MLVYSFPTLPHTSRLVSSFNCVGGCAPASARVHASVRQPVLQLGTQQVQVGLGLCFGASVPPCKSLCPHVVLP